MLEYRKLKLDEAERIAEIDATHFIKNVWRINGETLGCVAAAEKNEKLYEEDPRDIQLEYAIGEKK